MDAAILFSDILVIPQAMNIAVEIIIVTKELIKINHVF
jgi:uroporphyrinogen-III decarboxylase